MKIICVTGGVLSGIGKGITGASIGAILKSAGYRIFMQKFDGYLNIDPGTMNPIEHGEVFVTDDGAETDLDIGHYERYIDTSLTSDSSRTTGKIYQEIFDKERRGEFLGHTVQVVSHVAHLVQEKILAPFASFSHPACPVLNCGELDSGSLTQGDCESSPQGRNDNGENIDISLVEIGGTVGDMENEYLIEAVRQLRHRFGDDSVLFVHLVYLPYLGASGELKTKPAQNSVRDLRARGIEPDILVVRADQPIDRHLIKKISLMTGLPEECVIPSPTVKSIYQVPVNYHGYGLGSLIIHKLGLEQRAFDLSMRNSLVHHIDTADKVLKIAMVGKYTALEDAYYSLNEGLKVAGYWQGAKVKLEFVDSERLERQNISEILSPYDGIVIPGGFGNRGIEGMILAAQYAREHSIPYLGICLGSQIMAIEFARNVLGYSDADSEEFSHDGVHNVVHLMESQKGIYKKGGTMRLGSYKCKLDPSSLAFQLYAREFISERHRHRYEFNNDFRQEFEKNGFHISGTSLDGELVEVVEIAEHPFMIATQAHPEFKSRPLSPHPLFVGLIKAMMKT